MPCIIDPVVIDLPDAFGDLVDAANASRSPPSFLLGSFLQIFSVSSPSQRDNLSRIRLKIATVSTLVGAGSGGDETVGC